MKVRKKWWLLPVIIVLMIVGALLVFAQGSALAPFIHDLLASRSRSPPAGTEPVRGMKAGQRADHEHPSP
jgi:hypothetical protein